MNQGEMGRCSCKERREELWERSYLYMSTYRKKYMPPLVTAEYSILISRIVKLHNDLITLQYCMHNQGDAICGTRFLLNGCTHVIAVTYSIAPVVLSPVLCLSGRSLFHGKTQRRAIDLGSAWLRRS